MAKQQNEIVVAAQKVAKAEAKRAKVVSDHEHKVAFLDAEIQDARATLRALMAEA